jgi:AraC-like DNA-binding protein
MLLGVRDAPPAGLRFERAAGRHLAGAVLGYRAYHETAAAPRDRWETPSGDVILVLGLGDPFQAQRHPGAGDPTGFRSFVVGLHERPLHTRYAGVQIGVQVRLAPPAAAAILGVPMHELTNRVVELTDLAGAFDTATLDTATLDTVLAERLRAGAGPSPIVRRAWASLRRAGGNLRIEDLVAEAGCSHRHLVELFRREVGLTPKRAARVLRYERAARRLREVGAAPAAVAAEGGFTDQPHLTREFRRFAGVTPGSVSFRQDPDGRAA